MTVLALILILTLLFQDGVDTINATAVELIVVLSTVSVIVDAMICLGPPASEPTAHQLRRHGSGRRRSAGRGGPGKAAHDVEAGKGA